MNSFLDTIFDKIQKELLIKDCFTSGKSNRPEYILENLDDLDNYGFYSFHDNYSRLKPPIVAKAIVGYKDSNWRSSSIHQRLFFLIVYDKFLINDFLNINIGNELLDVTKNNFVFLKEKDDVKYFKNETSILLIKFNGNSVKAYILADKCLDIDLIVDCYF
ncbi:hypothetical protein [Aureivirga sp. CE67]|uniref:hypothetical protein n=1 Tax=Aureivirga sp. CE67 TaxID=1788983 RepID=UPI0018C97DD3|nr:hypothetical protein [Aureivirga sp. CE67]